MLPKFRVPALWPIRTALCLLAANLSIAPTVLQAQTRRALLIGIDHYSPPPDTPSPVNSAGHAQDSRFGPGNTWRNLTGPLVDVASMTALLKDTYGFTDIRLLTDADATRQGILDAIDRIAADAQPNDRIVIYYAGHGSQRRDTRSSKNKLDETIVPSDAWKGTSDIRDKELALRFNHIVYNRHARLTAIYDSCHSGTMARGITNSVQRTLPYDDRDVAFEKGATTEADLKQIPQNGDAIIIAAAAANESAAEAEYPEDGQTHGAFTRALVRVLEANTQALSGEDVVAAVSSMLHADNDVPFQQPSVEGRVHESLFGDPIAQHALHARVIKVTGSSVTLDLGSAAGFDVATEFTATQTDATGAKTVIEVKSVDSATASRGAVVQGSASVQVGQIFELSKRVYPRAARLVVFLPRSRPIPDAAAIAAAKALFPALTWVDDPAATVIQFLVVEGASGWQAFGQNGKPFAPGSSTKGSAFLLLGTPPAVVDRIRSSLPFERGAFQFTDKLADANYLLTLRLRRDGKPEYALFDPIVLAPHALDAWVHSLESDQPETDANEGVPPEIVCRNDVSLPVRTAWLHNAAGAPEDSIAPLLDRRIIRLGRLRTWLQMPALAPGAPNWPYRLSVSPAGPLHLNDSYAIQIAATEGELATRPPTPKYLYLFGFDCAANPAVLYPEEQTNGEAKSPQPGPDGKYPAVVNLIHEPVTAPLGADTIFFMATAEKVTSLEALTNDGTMERARGLENPFDQLMMDANNAATRGFGGPPTNWLVQQVVIPSRP